MRKVKILSVPMGDGGKVKPPIYGRDAEEVSRVRKSVDSLKTIYPFQEVNNNPNSINFHIPGGTEHWDIPELIQQTKIKRIPIVRGNEMVQSYNPKQVLIPNIPSPKVGVEGWYSNNQNIPYDAEDVSKLYNEDGTRKYRNGGQYMKQRVRIVRVPEMAYGGQIATPTSTGVKYRLDRSWNNIAWPSMGQAPDAYKVGRTLPEAEEGDPNNTITVEKNEQILGDFNQDGTPALMQVDTGSHASGNDQDVNVPNNAFVFSDTKALKIKDKATQKNFGMAEKARGYTPAEIAKKYNLQKYTAVVSNPNSDPTSKKTAQLMIDNFQKKLSELANVQEGMKGHMGIANPQDMPTGQYGGMYPTGGPTGAAMGNTFRFDRPLSDEQQWDLENKPEAAWMSNQLYGQPSGGQFNDNRPGLRTNFVNMYHNDPYGNIQPLPITGTAGNPTPDTFSPTPTNMQTVTPGNNMGTIDPDKDNAKIAPHKAAFTSPDTYGMYLRTLQAATVPHDLVYRAPVTGVIPDAVYQDPRRAMASIAEQANSRGREISQLSGPGRQANLLQLQGQAGSKVADVVGEYANKNAMIANEANQRAAGITNQILEQQRERSNDLVRDTSNANLQYKKRQNEANSNLLNKYTEAWTNRQGYDDLNQTNQFYKRDPRTGLMYFNSPEAKAAFDRATNGVPGSAGKIRSISELKQSYIDSGGDPDHAAEFADDAYREQYGLRNKSVSTHNEGKNNTKTTTYNPQKYGGSITNQNLQKFFKKTLLS